MEHILEQGARVRRAEATSRPRSIPPAPRVPASGRVFGAEEIVELVRTSLDFWLTAGPEARAFEKRARAPSRPPPRAARQLRLVGQPARR